MRRHPAAHDPIAERGDRHEERILRVGRGGAGGEHQVRRLGTAGEPAERRLDGIGIVVDVDDVDDLRPEPSISRADRRLEPLARSRPDRSLTTTPTRRATNGDTSIDGLAAEPRDPRPASITPASTSGHLDARDEIALLDDLSVMTVNTSSGSSRLIRSSSAIRTVTTPGTDATRSSCSIWSGAMSSPDPAIALASAERPRPRAARCPSGRARSPSAPGCAASANRSSDDRRRPFDQRFLPTVRSRVRTAPEPGWRAPTWGDPLDAQCPTLGRSALPAERGVDGAPNIDLGHLRPIRAVGVDIAVDGLAVGRMGGGGRHRVGRTVEPVSADSTAFARYGTSDAGDRDARVRDRAPDEARTAQTPTTE